MASRGFWDCPVCKTDGVLPPVLLTKEELLDHMKTMHPIEYQAYLDGTYSLSGSVSPGDLLVQALSSSAREQLEPPVKKHQNDEWLPDYVTPGEMMTGTTREGKDLKEHLRKRMRATQFLSETPLSSLHPETLLVIKREINSQFSSNELKAVLERYQTKENPNSVDRLLMMLVKEILEK